MMKRSNPVQDQQLREVMSERAENPNDLWLAEETTAFENDPQGWKEPNAAPSYQASLAERFEEMYTEESLLTTLRPPLTEGTPAFFDHVKALWAQRAREQDPKQPATEREIVAALPGKERIRAMLYLDGVLRTVFEWMKEEGQDPIPGLSQWPQTIPDHVLAKLDD